MAGSQFPALEDWQVQTSVVASAVVSPVEIQSFGRRNAPHLCTLVVETAEAEETIAGSYNLAQQENRFHPPAGPSATGRYWDRRVLEGEVEPKTWQSAASKLGMSKSSNATMVDTT